MVSQDIKDKAQMAAASYPKTLANAVDAPEGWTQVRVARNASASGFAAAVFQRDVAADAAEDIVIALTGTNETMKVAFALANVPVGIGAASSQVIEAGRER